MQNIPIYEALAQAFVAEGVDTHFTLMGDGNMHWVAAMQKRRRHEHLLGAARALRVSRWRWAITARPARSASRP